jgi:putative PIN family toxin of toxin-antitoxin system
MNIPEIVIDSNVLVAALRSKRGASHHLIWLIGSDRLEINISVPLVLEYEAAATRIVGDIPLDQEDIDAIIDYICKVAHHRQIYFLWRPFLKDPGDDMVLELAVTSGSEIIVTYNVADFEGAEQFGVRVMTAKEFLEEIGEI